MKHLGDITKISGYTAPVVDCIIGGSPCQDLSVAGKRAGLDGERSGLFMDQVRIVKEMRERDKRNGKSGVDVRPRHLVWENVPGALSSNHGQDFKAVLEELAKVADENAVIPMPEKGKWTNSGCIVGDGWSIAWRILDAQFWGVPQRRRRIALVADFGGESAPEILFVRKGVSGNLDESKQKGKATATDAPRSIRADDTLGVDLYNTAITGDVQATLGINCGMSHGRNGVLCYDIGDVRTSEAVVYTVDQGGGKSGVDVKEDKAPTLTTTHDGSPAVIYALDRASYNQCKNASYDFEVTDKGINSPLVAKGPGAVAYEKSFIDVEMEVAVRKYEVNTKLLCECLRDHKGGFTNKEIAEALGKPLTLVEHWFRSDSSFAIPDADIWYSLKDLLGIQTTEFDKSITEYEFKGGNYDMRNRIHTSDIAPTLACGCGNNLHLLPKYIDTSHADDVVRIDDTVGPLQARDYKGGKLIAYGFNPSATRDVGQYFLEDIGNTLVNGSCPGHHNGVCFAVDCRNATEDLVNGALQSNSAHSLNGNNVVRTRYIVRRLTPLECERLQGYPDNWTNIGDWVDSNGKKRQTSDAARYKALGNSIAVPVFKWVLKRLCACYERDATMASLFDGIGGFPLIWEQINGKGSCLWASEVEEFPIAVTKLRIGD